MSWVCRLFAPFLLMVSACHKSPSVEDMERKMSREFPLGMTFDEASRKAKEDYSHVKVVEISGFYRQQGVHKGAEVGDKSISFVIGEYRDEPFALTVLEANLAFDNSGRLIEIWVRQTRDAP